jgi:hypothetical protein
LATSEGDRLRLAHGWAVSGQQFEATQSANITARMANSAKARAKNINIALMAIPRQQGVPLQSEYLFHNRFPSLATLPEMARAIRDGHHSLELFQVCLL